MADAKTTALTAATSWASGDLLYMVSNPGGTPASRKITLDNVLAAIPVNGAASTPPLKLTGTWFTGGSATTTKPQLLIEPSGTTSTAWSTSGTGIGVNAPSGFAGRLFDGQVNGSGKFYVDASGNVICSQVECPATGASRTAAYSQYGVSLGNGIGINFYTATNPTGAANGVLLLDAANTVALRNGTNAQALNVYGTYTSGSVYERAFVRYSVANTRFEIGTEHTGASAKALYISTGSNLTLESSGNLVLTQGSVNILLGSGSALSLMPNTATAAGGVRGFQLGSTSNFGVYYGSGAPTVAAAKGSLYLRSDGSGTSDRMYVNTDGGTTWTAVTTVA